MKHPSSTPDLAVAETAELYAIALASGISHREALLRLARRIEHRAARDFVDLTERMRQGESLEGTLDEFQRVGSSARLQDFGQNVALSIRLGTPVEVSMSRLAKQIRKQWLVEYQLIAKAAETRMLLPQVAITLPLTILFALYPSLRMLGGSFA